MTQQQQPFRDQTTLSLNMGTNVASVPPTGSSNESMHQSVTSEQI